MSLPKVLVVDDHSVMRQSLGAILRQLRFKPIFAQNGMEAVSSLGENPDIALMLVDINMPVMGGMEFVEFIRENNPELNNTPILMVTTESDNALIKKAKALKVSGWLTKPVDTDKLKGFIQALVKA